MDASTPINRSGMVMVSMAGLRRLLAKAYQSEMTEEMLVSVIDKHSPGNAYYHAGLQAECRWVPVLDPVTGRMTDPRNEIVDESDLEGACYGSIYLDRERVCDECGRRVVAPEVVAWIREEMVNGDVVKSYEGMDTEEFWEGNWAEFERIENADAGELARRVGTR